MATNTTFVPPAWLEGQDAETIHARMMQNLPDDIDDTEGGFPWDFTKPTALEKAELLEFHMMETTKIMHYMFSYGIYLDYHAKAVGITRKEASRASGNLQITGSPGTVIPNGFLFAVPASGDTAAITFHTTEEATINTDGEATVPIQATETGTIGNVAADTIIIMVSPSISGIERITNLESTSGGAAEEDDESLRSRIGEICEASDASFVGCDNDYSRWAKEINGVGDVIVIAEWNGPGTVKVVVMDANGQPANDKIIEDVENHIMAPNDRRARLAPIGATVTITAPTTVDIDVACDLTIAPGEDYTAIVANIGESLKDYFETAQKEGIIKRNRIGSIVIGTDGVADYANLTLNGETGNITLALDEYPKIIGQFATAVSATEV